MLSEQELGRSPLFHDISYQDYREILTHYYTGVTVEPYGG